MDVIALDSLTKHYPGGRGVTDVTLTVPTGEVHGFIGPNGAGKSTTIRTILGLLSRTRGDVRLFEKDIDVAYPALRARVGYMPSEPHLIEGMTVGDLLAYLGSFFADDTRARREQLARALDLDLSRETSDLSLGNKKKVALVGALQHGPSLLILDEPTSGLDPLIQRRLAELLAEEKARGTTVFFSSHVLSEVEQLCDRLTVLKEGRVVETTSVEAIKARSGKHVRLRTTSAGATVSASTLPGARDVVRDGDLVHFVYRGSVKDLLGALARDPVDDVRITEPSLEEIVLGHYATTSSTTH